MNFHNNGDKVYTVGDIDRLERENAEIKAQVEQLREWAYGLINVDVVSVGGEITGCVVNYEMLDHLGEILNKSPAKHLTELEIASKREGFIYGQTHTLKMVRCGVPREQLIADADCYANQLRQQAKAGE